MAPGIADQSYALYVAAAAGLPSKVLDAAIARLLKSLATTEPPNPNGTSRLALALLRKEEINMPLTEAMADYTAFWAHEMPGETLMNVLK